MQTIIKEFEMELIDKTIQQHLHDLNFSIDLLCTMLKISRMTLHRKIKIYRKCSTSSYIRKQRLARAKQLMQSTDLSIKEISFWVGFNDQGYFSKMFSKEYGQSPKAFKQQRHIIRLSSN